MVVTTGRIVHFQVRDGVFRPFHVTDAVNNCAAGWVLMSPDDLGCDQHGCIPVNTPQSPWRAYKNVQEGNAVGQWRWPPKV